MFTVHCPRHGQEILLDTGRIRGLDSTADGVVVTWECWCGHVGSTATGRPARRPATPRRPVIAPAPTPAPQPRPTRTGRPAAA